MSFLVQSIINDNSIFSINIDIYTINKFKWILPAQTHWYKFLLLVQIRHLPSDPWVIHRYHKKAKIIALKNTQFIIHNSQQQQLSKLWGYTSSIQIWLPSFPQWHPIYVFSCSYLTVQEKKIALTILPLSPFHETSRP